jgi:WD40 repeat protein/transcriptional regulator with XRE-family HTH domain/ABC-type Fe3+/spermidine/putrescine transport system ATPase subunit
VAEEVSGRAGVADPRRVHSRQEFADELTLLRERAGLTVRDVAKLTQVPVATLGGYFSGRHMPAVKPPDMLRRILSACGVQDGGTIEEWLDALRRVRRTPGRPAAGAPIPYRGLASFQPEDAEWFYGRQRLTGALIEQFASQCVTGDFIVAVGPSGSGKSSLLRAGVIPALRSGPVGQPGSKPRRIALFTPGARPLHALAAWLATFTNSDVDQLATSLLSRPDLCADLLLKERRVEPGPCDPADDGDGQEQDRAVVIVDQFEEIFTACQDEAERRSFIAALQAAAQCRAGGATGQSGGPGPAALVVLGLRADFYAHALRYPEMVPAIQDHQVVVGPMTEAELRSVIVEPARKAKLEIEDGLVEVLLRDLAPAGYNRSAAAQGAGALPLLSHALLTTWDRARHGRLTIADYLATGGIEGAVARTAEEVYSELTPAQQDLARRTFTRLIHVADGTADTRRRVSLDELQPGEGDAEYVLDCFIGKRLITTDEHEAQITHEALLPAWPRLREWVDADREGLRVHRQLTVAAEVWRDADCDPSTLYRGGPLTAASDWAADRSHYADLNVLERRFLTASMESRLAEGRAARRRTRRLQQLVTALTVLVLVTGFLTAYAFRQQASATSQRDLAISRQVAIEADQLRSADPALAMQLSLAAYQIAPTAEARTSLLEATGGPPVTRLLGPAGAELNAIAYSPDHALLALGSANGTIQLWDVGGPGRPAALGPPLAIPPPGSVTSLAFSGDGRILIAGSTGATVTEWGLANPARPARLAVLRSTAAEPVKSVASSPDGHVVVASSGDRVYVWDTAGTQRTAAPAASLDPGTGQVDAVAVSPDGGTLAAVTSAGQVPLWRLRAGKGPAAIGTIAPPGTAEALDAVSYSPDGRILAVAGDAGKIWLWTLAPGQRPVIRHSALTGSTGFIYALAFSPDGQSVAAGSADSNAYIWNLSSGLVTAVLPHPAPVLSLAFGARGRALATADTDGAARIWQLPGPVLTGPTGAVFAVAYSPDGHDVAAGSGDGTVRLWNVSDLGHPVPLGGPLTSPASAHAALDGPVAWGRGGRLAAGTVSGGIQLWNAADPQHPVALHMSPSGLTSFIQNVTFDSSGRLMAAASAAGTIEVWDTATFDRPVPLAVIRDVPPGSSQGVLAVSISRDDRVLAAAGDDGSVRLWDITHPSRPTPVGGSHYLASLTATAYQVTFSPDGSLLAESGEDGKVRLWQVTDPARPRLLTTLTGPQGIVYDVTFSPDGHTLATSDGDKTIRLWDITDPARPGLLDSLTGPAKAVFAASFSPNGNALVAGSQDDTVRLWLTSPALAASYVCSLAGTRLTSTEWARYIPALAYRPPCAGSG